MPAAPHHPHTRTAVLLYGSCACMRCPVRVACWSAGLVGNARVDCRSPCATPPCATHAVRARIRITHACIAPACALRCWLVGACGGHVLVSSFFGRTCTCHRPARCAQSSHHLPVCSPSNAPLCTAACAQRLYNARLRRPMRGLLLTGNRRAHSAPLPALPCGMVLQLTITRHCMFHCAQIYCMRALVVLLARVCLAWTYLLSHCLLACAWQVTPHTTATTPAPLASPVHCSSTMQRSESRSQATPKYVAAAPWW